MSFLSTGSPTLGRKSLGGKSFPNDDGLEVRALGFGHEPSVSENTAWVVQAGYC